MHLHVYMYTRAHMRLQHSQDARVDRELCVVQKHDVLTYGTHSVRHGFAVQAGMPRGRVRVTLLQAGAQTRALHRRVPCTDAMRAKW